MRREFAIVPPKVNGGPVGWVAIFFHLTPLSAKTQAIQRSRLIEVANHQQTHPQQTTLLRRGRESMADEESLQHERLKHSGEQPLVGVKTFLDAHRGENVLEAATLTRSTKEDKDARLAHVRDFQKRHEAGPVAGRRNTAGRREPGHRSPAASLPPWKRPTAYALARLPHTARAGGNLFAELLQTVASCSLGQITHALYEVGGQYRRSM